MGIAEFQGHNLVAQHPALFTKTPVRAELADAPDRIYFTTYTLCDTEAFTQNTAALTKLASNMNRFSSVVNRFGIVPWAEQVTEIRVILEGQLGEG